MAYKRYAKKNGKVYGPYYYESYRENGVVKKLYIGQKPSKSSSGSFVPRIKMHHILTIGIAAIVIMEILFTIFFLVPTTGKVTLQSQPTYSLGEQISGQLAINILEGDSVQKDTEIKLSLTKNNMVLAESTKTFEQFLGTQINYVTITNETLSCANITVPSGQEVCTNVTTPGTTTLVCHDELVENVTVPVCVNETTPDTVTLVCTNQTAEAQVENCTTANVTDSYYQTPGAYSKPIQDFFVYNLSEAGTYILRFDIPALGVIDEKTLTVAPAENLTENLTQPPAENLTENLTQNATNKTRISFGAESSFTGLVLNTTDNTKNDTHQNLTLWILGVTGPGAATTKNITNWYLNSQSITLLNMPFEGGSNSTWTRDYAYGNNGTVVNATWNTTGGQDSKGAYTTDGLNDLIRTTLPDHGLSYSAWFKYNHTSLFQSKSGKNCILDSGNAEICINREGKVEASVSGDATSWTDTGRLGSETTILSLAVWNGNLYGGTGTGAASVYRYNGTGWSSAGSPPGGAGSMYALNVWNNSLYATGYGGGLGGIVFRYNGGSSWTSVGGPAGGPHGSNINMVLAVWNGSMYLGTGDGFAGYENVTRYDGGTTWTEVSAFGTFGGSYIRSFGVWNNSLFAGSDGVYRYNGGTTWTLVSSFSDMVYAMVVWNSSLYASVATVNKVYRFNGGTSWTDVGGGFYGAMAVWNGSLYGSDGSGNVYRYGGGTSWTSAGSAGSAGYSLATFNGSLFAGTGASGKVYKYGNGSSIFGQKIGSGWNHVVLTVNNSATRLYLNGSLIGSAASSQALVDSLGSSGMLIGSRWGSSGAGVNGELFNGTIDDVLVYNRALSSVQITEMYQNNSRIITYPETEIGDVWNVCATPNNGTEDGSTVCSNSVTILESTITTCQSITASGNYYLTQDIQYTGGAACLIIDAPGTTIYCQGHSIIGDGTAHGVRLSNLPSITIRDCKITNNQNGIDVDGSTGSIGHTFENNTIINNSAGIAIASASAGGSFIIGNNITKNNGDGITLAVGTGHLVKNNLITNNSGGGISVFLIDSTHIENNTILRNAGYGLDINTDSGDSNVEIVGNNISYNGGRGITVSSNYNGIIENTSINFNRNGGIFAGGAYYIVFRNNTINSNRYSSLPASGGIILSNARHNMFIGNSVQNNSEWDVYYINAGAGLNNTFINMKSYQNTLTFILNGTALKGEQPATIPVADPSGKRNISMYVNATSTSIAGGWILLNISYSNADIAGVNESSLRVWRYASYGPAEWQLMNEQPYGVNTTANYVYANLSNFSTFGVFGSLITQSELSDCGDISSSGNYVLTHNVSSLGTCFNVTASHVELDCAGYEIRYDCDGRYNAYGVISSPAVTTNITVKNCFIVGNSTSTRATAAVNFSANNVNCEVRNNTIFINGEYDVYGVASSGDKNRIVQNKISVNGSGLIAGINLVNYPDNTIVSNNTINLTCGAGEGMKGINLKSGVVYANITANTIIMRRTAGSSSSSYGIYLDTFVNNNIISGNSISLSELTGNLGGTGIYLSSADFNLIANNSIRHLGGGDGSFAGINVGYSNNNTVVNNNVLLLGGLSGGIFLASDDPSYPPRGSRVYGNDITVNASIQYSCDSISAIKLNQAYGANIYSNNFSLLGTTGCLMNLRNSSYSVFANNTFSGNLAKMNYLNVSLVNLTNNQFGIAGNGSIRFAALSTLNGTFIVNSTNFRINNNLTFVNSSQLPFMNVSSVVTLLGVNATSPNVYVDFEDDGSFVACNPPQCNNITYNATNLTFIFNVSSFTTYQAQEGPIASSCGVISSDTTLSSNVLSNGTCFIANSDKITLDCAGYTITYGINGTNSSWGINVTGYNNVTIKNCIFVKGNNSGSNSYGIGLQNSTFSNAINNSINTTGTNDNYGIFMTGVINSTVLNNTINTNGTTNNYGVYVRDLAGNVVLADYSNPWGWDYNSHCVSQPNVNYCSVCRIDLVNCVWYVGMHHGCAVDFKAYNGGTFINFTEPHAVNYGKIQVVGGENVYCYLNGHIISEFYSANNCGGQRGYTVPGNYFNDTQENIVSCVASGSGKGRYQGVRLLAFSYNVPVRYSTGNLIDNNDINSNGNSNVFTNSSTSHGLVLDAKSDLNTISNNNISASGLYSDGIFVTEAASNVFINNSISYARSGIRLTSALANIFNNSYVSGSNPLYIGELDGDIMYTQDVNISRQVNLSQVIDVSFNATFVNSSDSAGNQFNKSAQLIIRNLPFYAAAPVIDINDLGSFAGCISPRCTRVNYTYGSGLYVVNVSSFTTYAAQETSVCQDIDDQGVFTLINDVNYSYADGPYCFNVLEDNVTLNCNGFRIFGNGNSIGIYANNTLNTTIRNCIISNFTDAVVFQSSSLGEISNCTMMQSRTGINFTGSSGNLIRGILLTNETNKTVGIVLNGSSNNFLIDINARFNYTLSSNYYGEGYSGTAITVSGGSGNQIVNSSLYNMTNYGIILRDGTSQNLIDNVTLRKTYSTFFTYGIYFAANNNRANRIYVGSPGTNNEWLYTVMRVDANNLVISNVSIINGGYGIVTPVQPVNVTVSDFYMEVPAGGYSCIGEVGSVTGFTNSNIKNGIIKSLRTDSTTGIEVFYGSNITNVTFTGEGYQGQAISLAGGLGYGANNTVSNCNFENISGDLININQYSSYNSIYNNNFTNFYNRSASTAGDVLYVDGKFQRIENNTFMSINDSDAISGNAGVIKLIADNSTAKFNNFGNIRGVGAISVSGSDDLVFGNNIENLSVSFSDSLPFYYGRGTGISFITSQGNNIVENNTIKNARVAGIAHFSRLSGTTAPEIIRNNHIINANITGLLALSQDITVWPRSVWSNNLVENTTSYGILMRSLINVTFINNTIVNTALGVYLYTDGSMTLTQIGGQQCNSHYITLENNSFVNVSEALQFMPHYWSAVSCIYPNLLSSGNIIRGNSFTNITTGMTIYAVESNILANNALDVASRVPTGILLAHGANNTVINNRFPNVTVQGIYMYNTTNNTLDANTVYANNISVKGILLDVGCKYNLVRNNMINLTGANSSAIEISNSTGTTIQNNSILGFTLYALNLRRSLNTTINNSYLPVNPGISSMFVNETNGTVMFMQALNFSNSTNLFQIMNISFNWTFVNSSNVLLGGNQLNKSAILTMYGINASRPAPFIDFNDAGSFVQCNSPQCTNLSYNGTTKVFVFNVSSFTTYRVQEEEGIRCGNVGSSIVLTYNLTAAGTCFNVTNNDVAIDCNGSYIFYNANGNDDSYGVYAIEKRNITVKNCIIQDINESGAYTSGVRILASNSSFVINNTIYTNGTHDNWGIHLEQARDNSVDGNRIYAAGSASRNGGIYLYANIYSNNMTNNKITTNGTDYNAGIFMWSAASDNLIYNNTISTDGSGNSNRGIYLYVTTERNNISSNHISTNGDSGNVGINLYFDAYNNTIEHNTINAAGIGSSNAGIGLYTYANGNNVVDNDITTNGSDGNEGIFVENNADNNIIYSNRIITNGYISGSNYGINLESAVSWNNVTNNNITTHGEGDQNYGIILQLDAYNSTVNGNSIFTNGLLNNYGIYLYGTVTGNGLNNNIVSASGTDYNHAVVLEINTQKNNFRNNRFAANGTASYGVFLTSASNNTFSLDILNDTSGWINSSNSFNNTFFNETFETLDGSIRFSSFQINGTRDVSREKVNVSSNLTFVNSTNVAFMNVSAEITLYGINLAIPVPFVDFEDDDSFVKCNPPQCKNLSYNIGTGIFVFNVSSFTTYRLQETDLVVPWIILNSPDNGSYIANNSVNFNWTAFDDLAATLNCNLTIDGIVNASNIASLNAIETNFTVYGFADGVHLWNVTCIDDFYNANVSETRTFIIDTTAPNATILAPQNNTYTNVSSQNFTLNVSDNIGLANATLYIYNQTGLYNQTTVNLGGAVQATIGVVVWLADGVYSWFWEVFDLAGNLFSTQTAEGSRTITENTLAPQFYYITLVPTSPAAYAPGQNYTFNITWLDDIQVGSVRIAFNGTVYNLGYGNGTYNFSVSDLAVGSYNYQWFANDTFGNSNQTALLTYIVNQATPPLSLLIQPGTTVIAGTETNATGSGCPNQLTCILYRNGAAVTNSDVVTLAVGSYNYVYNTTGNENYSFASVSATLTVNSEGGGGGCTDTSWTYGDWGACIDGHQTRILTSNCNSHNSETRDCCVDTGWTCDDWTRCTNNRQTRNCVSNCNNNTVEGRDCTCTPDWNCTSFSTCLGTFMSRTCTDLNNCGSDEGKPDERVDCGGTGCAPYYRCGNWSRCTYNNDANQMIRGIFVGTGTQERTCFDSLGCTAINLTEYRNCSSGVEIEITRGESCNRQVITLVDKATRKPITTIDLVSWQAKRLDVSFIQANVKYCPYCYDGIKDEDETGIDCGGSCRECRPEFILPLVFIIGSLLLLSLLLLIPILKISREDKDLIEQIRALIKSGKEALEKTDRATAENNFRQIKWLYIQIESKKMKRMILKEIQNYHRKIKLFSEF